MPGLFSWTHSLSCKSLCARRDADVLINEDSRSCSTESFSSSMASPIADMIMGSMSSRSRGCSPQITKLHEPEVHMIHGSSKILMKHSSPASPAAASKNNNNNDNNKPRKSTEYIHQSQTGEYYYKASPLKVKRVCKPRPNGNNKYNKNGTTDGGFMGCSDLSPGDNMCLIKGCCECSMIQGACQSSSFQDVAHHADDHGLGGASHNRTKSSSSPNCICPKCGEAFYKAEVLELHKISRHVVSRLKSSNSSLNVVEIIFKTSWQLPSKQNQITSAAALGPKIERILKIENTETTINDFEEYRNKVKERNAIAVHAGGRTRRTGSIRHDDGDEDRNNNNNSAGSRRIKKVTWQRQSADQRCVADGNELLRFFATSLSCDLGNNGCTNLCSTQTCNVCNIIRWGFVNERGKGIHTTATSGKAHEDFIAKQEKELQLQQLQQQQQKSTRRNSLQSKLQGKKPKKMRKKNKQHQEEEEQHAMLVCRVIAGRVRKLGTDQVLPALPAFSLLPEGYDSVAQDISSGSAAAAHGSYTTTSGHLDDLFVFDSMAVLPCFVVVYTI